MKIKLFTFLDEAKETYLNIPVLLKSPRKIISVKAIIDTGSPRTIVGYNEAILLQIPVNTLPKTEIIRLGGNKYDSRLFNKLKIVLKSEDNNAIEENVPVQVLKPTSSRDDSQGFSILIGTDFLKEKGYKLFCDIKNDEAYLEK